jgi:hypothetical protein
MPKTIKGLDELVRKLKTFEDLQKLRPAMMAGALHVKGKIAQYPPFSAANVEPSHGRWYKRGWGSKYKRLDGKVTGKKTSETLGRRWTVANRDRGLTKVIGNKASYARYVQSEEEQAGFHGDRGWKTDAQVIKEEQEAVLNFVKKEVDKILAR